MKYQVCRSYKRLVSVIYSNLSREDAMTRCQNLNDEHAATIPEYFVRIQRRRK